MKRNLIKVSVISFAFLAISSHAVANSYEQIVKAKTGLPKAYGASAYCIYTFKQTLNSTYDDVPVVSVFHVDGKNYEPLVPNAKVNIKIIQSESDEWIIEVIDNRSLPCPDRKYILKQTG